MMNVTHKNKFSREVKRKILGKENLHKAVKVHVKIYKADFLSKERELRS